MTAGPRPLVIQAEELHPQAAAWLAESCDLVVCRFDETPRFQSLLPQAQGLVVRTYTRVDAALLNLAPHLRVVARAGVGLDNIDVPECRRRGIQVVHTPDANTQAVAEYVFALLLDSLRPGTTLTSVPPAWDALRKSLTARAQLSELTLGIWGLGRIGSRVARIAQAFGMPTIYNDLLDIPPAHRHGATPVDVRTLASSCDVLSIHVDPRPANRHLLSAQVLASCKPGVVIVNTSRGMTVDAASLAAFLSVHPAATALIDVHDPEPFTADYPLLSLPNARLSPHLAAATATAHANMSWVVRDVVRVLAGQAPDFPAPA